MSEEEIYDMIHQEMSNHYFDMHKYGREEELRDMIAVSAMQGIVRHYDATVHNAAEAVAKSAYRYADAMLAERAKRRR